MPWQAESWISARYFRLLKNKIVPKVFTSQSQKTGELGEHIAARYLVRKGFKIIERNYTKPWGEIDIVARKGSRVHFIEVKSQTGLTSGAGSTSGGSYRPEENMHPQKVQRLRKTVQSYIAERYIHGEWQFDLVVVFLDPVLRQATVRFLEDIIL